jgi:hypothetical protein
MQLYFANAGLAGNLIYPSLLAPPATSSNAFLTTLAEAAERSIATTTFSSIGISNN